MHKRYGTITPAVTAFAIAGLLGSAQTLAQNAYIPGQLDNTVSVISTATNTVTTVIHDPSFNYPFPVAVAQDGSKVYVANYGLDHPPYSVSVISIATNTVTAVINDPSLNMPDGIAVTPNGRKVYVANCVGDKVSVIRTDQQDDEDERATKYTVTTITDPSFSEAVGVAVTPDGRTVYISNFAGNTVSVIDTATDKVTKVIQDPSFNFPWGAVVSPDGSKVYVVNNGPNFDGNTVSVIDTATNTVTETITLPDGKGPNAVAVTPDGSQVYVNNDSDIGGVSVIATATNTVGSIPTVDGFTTGVAVTPDGRKVYAVNGHSDNVSVIATATNMVVGSPITVGKFPAADGVFIQPRFAGTPGKANCFGQSVSALARTFGGFSSAAAALGYPSVKGLQNEILAYCRV